MKSNDANLTYHQITVADSVPLTAFLEKPDGGRIAFHPKYVQPAHLDFVGKGKIGIVVKDGEQIIGVGGAKLLESPSRQLVYIHSIVVAPSHRYKGIGSTIVQRLMNQASVWGNNICFTAHIQEGNTGSKKLFEKYNSQFFSNQQTTLVPLKRLDFPVYGNIETCTAVHTLPYNTIQDFYFNYQLLPEPQAIERWQHEKSNRQTFVYINPPNEIVAGINVSESFNEKLLVISKLPGAVEVLNRAFNLIPEDKMLRMVAIGGIWCKAGAEDCLRQLLAYTAKKYANDATFAAISIADNTIDPRLLGLKWWMLKTKLMNVVIGDEQFDEGKRPFIWIA